MQNNPTYADFGSGVGVLAATILYSTGYSPSILIRFVTKDCR